jgi:ATP-grasp domain
MSRFAIIVDPVSTGKEYAAAFRAAGVRPVAVLTDAEPSLAYRGSWHPENFDAVHVFDGDLPGLARRLRGYRPLCIIPGSELGVELYDALADLVCPGTGNVPALAGARRDKWGMAQALAAAGVPHLRQLCSADPDELAWWIRRSGLHGKPIVLKPPKSASSDHVYLVPPGTDWRPMFHQIYGQTNLTGLRNDAVLVQQYAVGTEFLVDSYSVDGRHGLVDVCRYTKSGRDGHIGLYDRVEFLPPDHPDVATVWAYTRDVLDAVGIRNGAGHTEVMLTAEGPLLMETASRPAGLGHQMITKLATGDNQIQRTIAHRVRGEVRPDYRLSQQLSCVFVSSPRAGVWRNADILDGLDDLPTFHDKHLPFGTGDLVPATEDLFTTLGWVILAGQDPAAIDADFRRIKALERHIDVVSETDLDHLGVPA